MAATRDEDLRYTGYVNVKGKSAGHAPREKLNGKKEKLFCLVF